MTRRAVLSGHVGDRWSEIAAITYPRMARYASSVGATFLPYVGERVPSGRHPAWMKLVYVADALIEHDEVLWLDADVLVVDSDAGSVFDEVPDWAHHAMCLHPDPIHPNTGVWVVRRPMLPAIVQAAMQDDCIEHKWWEQAAIIKVMQSERIPTAVLGDEWNAWSGSPSDLKPKFRHACGMPDQLAAIREWAAS